MKKFTSQEIKEFISKPMFDEKVILNKDPSWPKISIVTPSYNHARFLENTILSVLNQNYPNLEYIIIDGSSKDGSVEIIKKYEKYLTYWVSEPDNGQSHAINKGIEQATGDIFNWINADDILEPSSLEAVAMAWQSNPNKIIAGSTLFILADGTLRQFKTRVDSNNITFKNMLEFWKKGYSWTQPGSFLPMKPVREVGILDQSLHMIMDYELMLRLLLRTSVTYIPYVLARFRSHPNSKSGSIGQFFYVELADIVPRYARLAPEVTKKEVKGFQAKCLVLAGARELYFGHWGSGTKLIRRSLWCNPIVACATLIGRLIGLNVRP